MCGGIPASSVVTLTNTSRDRNTVSTANGAVIGLRLYEVTRNTAYLTWAKTMLGWLDRCMLTPNGLYWDHIDLSGRVNTAQWSYN